MSSGIIRHGSALRPQPQLPPQHGVLAREPTVACSPLHLAPVCVAMNDKEVLPALELHESTVLAHLWLMICFFCSSLVCTETLVPSCTFRK